MMAQSLTKRSASAKENSSGMVDMPETMGLSFKTSLNWIAFAIRGDVLLGVTFGHASRAGAETALRRILGVSAGAFKFVSERELEALPAVVGDLVERLDRYAAGEAVDFSKVMFDESHLTQFGRRVVAACRHIKRGRTRSYGELAAECGSPGAARAVGQVMAKNRYPLVVPCHRVLGSGGSIGGFSAPDGLVMKRRLLALEEQ